MRVPGLTGKSRTKTRSTPESRMKYEPFFRMVQQDSQYSKGVSMTQHPNPMTGIADLVTVTFDLRALQMEQMGQMAQMGIAQQQMQQQQQIDPNMVAQQQ